MRKIKKRTVVISEYRTMSYPVGFVDKAINLFATSALYNGGYLVSLEGGSYVCVYFNDCFFSALVRSCLQPIQKKLSGYQRIFYFDVCHIRAFGSTDFYCIWGI